MKNSILNYDYIMNYITTNEGEEVPYRWSHGAADMHLGDGMIVYSLIYFHKFKNLVCLGSGGGYIPRIMTQARYDLSQEGFYKEVSMEWSNSGSTYIVDACNSVNGEVDWAEEDSLFRRHFQPKFIKDTTENAYYNFFVKQDIKIDYLHIDADHTYEGCKQDFDLYSTLMNENGIISIHDSDERYWEDFETYEGEPHDICTGPSEVVKEVSDEWEVFNLFDHKEKSETLSSSGLTILRRI